MLRRLAYAAIVAVVLAAAPDAQPAFDSADIRAVVSEVARTVSSEYFDAAVGSRAAERLDPRPYLTPDPPVCPRDERRRVLVLTSRRTFSAGEGFAFLLQEFHHATIIGERTAGAANPGRPYPVGRRFEVTVPNGRVRMALSKGNWEGSGVRPDVRVAAAAVLDGALQLARQ